MTFDTLRTSHILHIRLVTKEKNMKKLFLLLMVSSMTIATIQAQSFGVKGGLSLANLSSSSDDVDQDGSRFGWVAGVFINLPVVEDVFSVQPELLFIQKGGDYSFSGIDSKVESSYIEIPVLLQLNILEPLYIYAGPHWSYLTSNYITYNDDGSLQVVEEDQFDDYNRMDVGGSIGLGLRYDHFFIDARLTRGAINFDKDRSIGILEFESRELKNFNIQLTTGYSF